MHVNVKPPSRHYPAYETADQAINHVLLFKLFPQQHWQDWHFGRDLADIRRATAAIKANDATAFVASRRRGYWRVELKGL
jgi:hypothetical protein